MNSPKASAHLIDNRPAGIAIRAVRLTIVLIAVAVLLVVSLVVSAE